MNPSPSTFGSDPAKLSSAEGVRSCRQRDAQPERTARHGVAGHQFGTFVPQLGDGRAILLGEVVDTAGIRRDIQLKGSGPTPFSRNGDGRAALEPVLREYIVSEANGGPRHPYDPVARRCHDREEGPAQMPLPGAVLTRVASNRLDFNNSSCTGSRHKTDVAHEHGQHRICRDFQARPRGTSLTVVDASTASIRVPAILEQQRHGVERQHIDE